MSHLLQRTVFKPSLIALGVLLALGGSSFTRLSLAAAPTAATEQTQRYDLPGGALLDTLTRISQLSRLTLRLRLREQDLRGYQTGAIKGEFTARQALAKALEGTALQVAGNADSSLSIASQQVDPGTTVLPTLIVEGARLAPSSNTALRTQTPLQQTAQSIKTISNETLVERQATSVEDALRNAAGVVAQKGNRGNAVYWVRGYEVTQTSTDGVTTPETRNGLMLPATPIDGVEGLEVIKGPAAVMAGSSSPGGTINIIRKAPVSDPLHVLRGEVTDRGEFKTAVDLGGAISDDQAWRYRLNVARTRSSETYPDYNGSRADYVAPVIDWQGDSTYVKVGAEFSDTRSAAGLAGTYYDTQARQIRKLSNYRMGDKDDHISGVVKTGYYELKQDLADGWSFNSKATHSDTDLDFRINETYVVQANGGLINHQFSALSTARYWSSQNDVRGTFDTGPVKHEVLVGVDYLHSNNAQYEYGGGRIITTGNINHRSTLVYPSIPEATNKSYDSRNIQRGLIVQDQITVFDNLHLLFAGKETVWKSDTNIVGGRGSSFRQRKWVPNYGIAYDLTPAVTLYANRLNGFSGSMQIDRVGNQLPPSTSEAHEAGLKFNLLDNRLSITTAVFKIEQTNVPVQDRTGQFLGSQGRNSKGFDLDINGQLLPGWNLTASYAYSKFEDPGEINGQANKVTGQPRHSGNLWTTYELQEGVLKGLGAGIGITTASNTLSGYRTSTYYDVPGYAQTDLSLFYRHKDWLLNLGMKNVFDKEIYAYSTATAWMGVKDGRTTRLTAEYRF